MVYIALTSASPSEKKEFWSCTSALRLNLPYNYSCNDDDEDDDEEDDEDDE